MEWSYKHEEGNEFPEIPEGEYRVRIASAEIAKSKNSGNDMMVLKFDVNGQTSKIWYYIVFLPDRPEITNRMLTQFFNSFDIPEGDFNLNNYIGRVGGAKIKHGDNGSAKVHYLIARNKQDALPPWASSNGNTVLQPNSSDYIPF